MAWLGFGIGSRLDLRSVGTHHVKQLPYVQQQKDHILFRVVISVIVQLGMLVFGYIEVN
jgi:hypothetical protein